MITLFFGPVVTAKTLKHEYIFSLYIGGGFHDDLRTKFRSVTRGICKDVFVLNPPVYKYPFNANPSLLEINDVNMFGG